MGGKPLRGSANSMQTSTISVEAAEVILACRDNIAHIGLSAPAVEPISPFANLVLVVGDLLRLDPEVSWGTHIHEFVWAAVDDLVCRRLDRVFRGMPDTSTTTQ